MHGNNGRQLSSTKQLQISIRIIQLYQDKYYDANFAHFTELLKRND